MSTILIIFNYIQIKVKDMAKQSKYIVTLEFNIFADDDKAAKKLAKYIEDYHDRKYDNRAEVTSLTRVDGFANSKEIDLK